MKRIYAIEAWCVDCKRCEVACKTFHSKSRNTVKALKAEFPPPQNRIRVEGGRQLSIAVNCRHCAAPKCVEGCVSGAMTKDPVTGVVSTNPEKCVGCRTCVSMCPFGCVRIEETFPKAVAFKCDLCGDVLGQPGEPSCVTACPNNALIYIESEG
ncbi:MAG: 4Fe-4S binding protein [Coriobacteriaceae bacterium]|jgi:carbon-monoxide dehydrogenase iron sulfur subunit|nr:4Fe-4S binding protein [Coriobacteriaceae bacterium]